MRLVDYYSTYTNSHNHAPIDSLLGRRRKNMRLENDQQFPTITARKVGGGEMTIPADLAGSWAVVLFYRGDW